VIDRLDDLRLFLAIISAGSLSEAARRSNLSLTSISRRLAGFEDRLGVRLFDRSARKFVLTAEGSLLQRRAASILDAVDSTVAEMEGVSGAVRGKLRISAPNAIGRRQISALCQGFVQLHPEVQLELVLSYSRPDVLKENLDLAIQTKRPTAGEVIQRKLISSRRVICAAPSYLEKHSTPTRPEDLTEHNCILMRRGSTLYDQWRVRLDGEIVNVSVAGSLVSNNSDTVLTWVRSGAGIAMKALWDIKDDLDQGRLIELLPNYACDDISLYATYSDRRNLHARLRRFLDYLADNISV
jgi:DNA-binding transcriptional LysR family regulator